MINIVGKSKYFFMLSALVILAGVIGFIIHGGFNLDIQFQGGTVIEVQMNDSNYNTETIESTIQKAIGKKVLAQKSITNVTSKGKNQKLNMLILSVASKNTLTNAEQKKVIDILKNDFKVKPNAQITVRNIQPSIGKQLLIRGLEAVAVASILIILYIWIRFKVMSGLSAGVTAVIGLLHDALIMLSIYTIFNIPLNESFIAAVLTILGYSMNDTIIIYDRIRENNSIFRKTPIEEMVNTSIYQTLSRSINTVVTVLISLITVYLFAYYNDISSLKEFTFPLIIGTASGAYSSIFIASPLWAIWRKYKLKKKVA